jgi:hypothetical protein
MKQQTAVEWLQQQLNEMESKSFYNIIQIEMGRDDYNHIVQLAKDIEKQQIIDFADSYGTYLLLGGTLSAATYNEIFNKANNESKTNL